jgi:hypothetical protein
VSFDLTHAIFADLLLIAIRAHGLSVGHVGFDDGTFQADAARPDGSERWIVRGTSRVVVLGTLALKLGIDVEAVELEAHRQADRCRP